MVLAEDAERKGLLMQDKVDSLLRRGIIFSIVWLAGIGSLYSLICAVRAKKLIDGSGGKLAGIGRVWWCFVVGGLGVLIWLPIIVMGILNQR